MRFSSTGKIKDASISASIVQDGHIVAGFITPPANKGNDGTGFSYDSTNSRWVHRTIVGGFKFVDVWDPSQSISLSNGPSSLTSSTGTQPGSFYVANKSSSVSLSGGIEMFSAGDWLLASEGVWKRLVPGYPVKTMYGRAGAIVAQKNDYTFSGITAGVTINPAMDKITNVDTSGLFSASDTYGALSVLLAWNGRDKYVISLDHGSSGNKIDSAGIGRKVFKTIHLLDGAVISSKIKDSSVTNLKIKDLSIRTSSIVSGTIEGVDIAPNSIGAHILQNGTVQHAQFANNAVSLNDLKSFGVSGDDIASNAILVSKIKNRQISSRLIRNTSITAGLIKDGHVIEAKFKNKGISPTKNIVDNSISKDKIARGAIDSSHVKSKAITKALIANTVDSSSIASGAITTAKIGNNQINQAKIGRSTLVADNFAVNVIDSSKVKDGAVTERTLRNLSITGLKFKKNSVTSPKLGRTIAIGSGGGSNAILSVNSTTQGVLLPNVNLKALGASDAGMLVYTPSLKQPCLWDGTQWILSSGFSCPKNAPCENKKEIWLNARDGMYIKYYSRKNSVVSSEIAYKVVQFNGRLWLDRNIGATSTDPSSADSFGSLYQWGRGTDGHQVRTSGTSTGLILLSDAKSKKTNKFITNSDASKNWLKDALGNSIQNTTLWDLNEDDLNPCPYGWRLPNRTELEGLFTLLSSPSKSSLRIPLAGYRTANNGQHRDSETSVHSGLVKQSMLWSNEGSSSQSTAYYFLVNEPRGFTGISEGNKRTGASVRCIKD